MVVRVVEVVGAVGAVVVKLELKVEGGGEKRVMTVFRMEARWKSERTLHRRGVPNGWMKSMKRVTSPRKRNMMSRSRRRNRNTKRTNKFSLRRNIKPNNSQKTTKAEEIKTTTNFNTFSNP